MNSERDSHSNLGLAKSPPLPELLILIKYTYNSPSPVGMYSPLQHYQQTIGPISKPTPVMPQLAALLHQLFDCLADPYVIDRCSHRT